MKQSANSIQQLIEGIENIRDFIGTAAKKAPDRKLTGYMDHVCYMYDILDNIISVFKYFDDPWLNKKLKTSLKNNATKDKNSIFL